MATFGGAPVTSQRPSLGQIQPVMVYTISPAMREGRRRPSLGWETLAEAVERLAAMREGRRRPSLYTIPSGTLTGVKCRNEGGAPAPLVAPQPALPDPPPIPPQ